MPDSNDYQQLIAQHKTWFGGYKNVLKQIDVDQGMADLESIVTADVELAIALINTLNKDQWAARLATINSAMQKNNVFRQRLIQEASFERFCRQYFLEDLQHGAGHWLTLIESEAETHRTKARDLLATLGRNPSTEARIFSKFGDSIMGLEIEAWEKRWEKASKAVFEELSKESMEFDDNTLYSQRIAHLLTSGNLDPVTYAIQLAQIDSDLYLYALKHVRSATNDENPSLSNILINHPNKQYYTLHKWVYYTEAEAMELPMKHRLCLDNLQINQSFGFAFDYESSDHAAEQLATHIPLSVRRTMPKLLRRITRHSQVGVRVDTEDEVLARAILKHTDTNNLINIFDDVLEAIEHSNQNFKEDAAKIINNAVLSRRLFKSIRANTLTSMQLQRLAIHFKDKPNIIKRLFNDYWFWDSPSHRIDSVGWLTLLKENVPFVIEKIFASKNASLTIRYDINEAIRQALTSTNPSDDDNKIKELLIHFYLDKSSDTAFTKAHKAEIQARINTIMNSYPDFNDQLNRLIQTQADVMDSAEDDTPGDSASVLAEKAAIVAMLDDDVELGEEEFDPANLQSPSTVASNKQPDAIDLLASPDSEGSQHDESSDNPLGFLDGSIDFDLDLSMQNGTEHNEGNGDTPAVDHRIGNGSFKQRRDEVAQHVTAKIALFVQRPAENQPPMDLDHTNGIDEPTSYERAESSVKTAEWLFLNAVAKLPADKQTEYLTTLLQRIQPDNANAVAKLPTALLADSPLRITSPAKNGHLQQHLLATVRSPACRGPLFTS